MDAIETFRSQFLTLAGASKEPGFLSRARKDAFGRFLDRGFPTTSEEEWRFTNVGPLTALSFQLPARNGNGDASAILARSGAAGFARHQLVFVNGLLREDLSVLGELPRGVAVTSLARALERDPERLEPILARERGAGDTAFADLNLAFLADGAYVFVPRGVVVEHPIQLVYLTAGPERVVSHPRTVIVLEAASEARVIETYVGLEDSVYFTNAVTEAVAEDGAVLDHYRLQRESGGAFHVASVDLVQGRSSSLSNHSLSFGARLARNDIRAVLDGEGAELTLNGLYRVGGRQHVDHHTVIDHKEPHGTSRELYKGVLDDSASAVFNGRIIVRPDAQKTDARQTNKNLLLSRDALVNTNPQLEIHADDVKCAHGATIGQLDDDALFYLRSRGLDPLEARRILTEGFVADVTGRIRIAALRDSLNALSA